MEVSAASGAVERISHPADAHGMNWVVSADENPWHTRAHNWGLGYCRLPAAKIPLYRWEESASITVQDDAVTSVYECPGFRLTITRTFDTHDRLAGFHTFTNTTDQDIAIRDLGIYMPFNDNYPDADTCLTRRCNAHVWCGGSTSYVCAMRMGGAAPHLGMVLTNGSVVDYSLQGRDDRYMYSQNRGDLILHPEDFTLEPRQCHLLRWVLFWHEGWEDFFRQASEVHDFVRMEAKQYVLFPGEALEVTAEGREIDAVLVNDVPVPVTRNGNTVLAAMPVEQTGEVVVKVHSSEKRETFLRALVTLDPLELIRRRARFIVEKQQVNDPSDPRDGACLVYDRENDGRWTMDWPWDHNEARERMGMGALLAQYLQREADPAIDAAVRRYHRFARTKLQDDQYRVYSSYHRNEDPTRLRMYNFPLLAHFHLEMFRYTRERPYLDDFLGTMRAYYELGGHRFYAINVPVYEGMQEVRASGTPEEAEALLADFRRHAARIMENGVHYPIHEVNYEQSIVAPAATLLLEMYLVTGEQQYLDAVTPHLAPLEAFNGKQPDYHLHEVAIRHWDGYWFGKYRVWGDTFPHYWSTLTGVTFHRLWQATGDETYKARAETILRNNLCLFDETGWGSCAYLYPRTIEGRPGGFYDPNANDQDWALVHYLWTH